MSKNILFISEQRLKDRSNLSDNVDPKELLPTVKYVQDRYVLPLCGTKLYLKLQADIQAYTLAGAYKELIDFYITDALVWYTLSEMPISMQYKLLNKGVMQRSSESAQPISFSDLVKVMDAYKDRGEYYAQQAIRYLCENQSSFPEYLNPGFGADVVQPDITQYTCGIVLK